MSKDEPVVATPTLAEESGDPLESAENEASPKSSDETERPVEAELDSREVSILSPETSSETPVPAEEPDEVAEIIDGSTGADVNDGCPRALNVSRD